MVLALRSAGSKIPSSWSRFTLRGTVAGTVACEISVVVPKPARTKEILSAVAHALRAPAAHREDLEVTRQSQARKESGQNVVEFLET